MSEPAMFALIRDGQARAYGNRWASVFLHREVIWGPDDFEAWVTRLEEVELDDWQTEDNGILADYDRKKLVLGFRPEPLQIPRLDAVYSRLLKAAWPGFEIVWAGAGSSDLARYLGLDQTDEASQSSRPETVALAARIAEGDDEDEDEDNADADGEEATDGEDEIARERFGDEEVRAWVTIIAADGTARHRHLERLSDDLLRGSAGALSALAELPPAVVPPEAVVAEGMWIDESKRTIDIWGDRALQQTGLPQIRENWQGWTVVWADGGYAEQCQACGLAGVPLSDAEALAKILPVILSTKRFDMSTVFGALGGGIKRTAVKATGCLLFVVCLPLVIFGLVSGNWKAVGISVGVTVAVVIAAFKYIEYRFKRSFRKKVSDVGSISEAPPAAGPLDESLRRQRLDGTLAQARLPRLSEVEPLFPKQSELDLLS